MLDKFGDGFFVHGLRIAVDKDDFMASWRERFEEKHPKVRHEIASNPIVRVIEQDPHAYISVSNTLRGAKARAGRLAERFVVQKAARKAINRC